ncbi:ribonuclease H-like protein [Hyphopichia burtonii NRRL Y-1933]|uniref:Ribonuclease H-like protein n=1 Tax=Hyphopichia burtonii NRRL Y-1933 TaxID=984485 RepID=A0A1E4RIV3_9ASCO|nr:ribonuclease H-like protein [Hyphopichia burtonii NRRL Y-1933]ODV67166.1 ribonuclease H-like protein [Hyphopichia burtonii NRRL Y-1933]
MNYSRTVQVLSKYKSSTLTQVALNCGFPTEGTKQNKIDLIYNGLKLYNVTGDNIDILSIDIGIKNFAYCKSKLDFSNIKLENWQNNKLENWQNNKLENWQNNQLENWQNNQLEIWQNINLENWQNINLNEKFKYNQLSNIIDEKNHLSYLSNCIINQIIMIPPFPKIITIENQRTRSNGLTATLPTVLTNYTLENMLYSSIYTNKLYNEKFNPLVIPLNSRNMVNFWINRFLKKSNIKFNSLLTKKLRINLVLHLLTNNIIKLDIDLKDLSIVDKKPNYLLKLINAHSSNKISKIDDLVDCLLYNYMMIQFLQNQSSLANVIQHDLDLDSFVNNLNDKYFEYAKNLNLQMK